MADLSNKIYVRTPLIESKPLSEKNACKVMLKLENVQPVGSFKLRGVSYHCRCMVKSGCKHIVCSSGGNAGLAAAYTGRQLGVPVTVFVPKSTSQDAKHMIKREGANVVVFGEEYDDANQEAMRVIKDKEIQDGYLIHPFDHPNVWKGHATMIDEIKEDLAGVTPDAVVVAVGGGGLLCGVVEGLKNVGWNNVPVIAMETIGADSFNKSVLKQEIITLPAITSIAKCLGARRIADQAFEVTRQHAVVSRVVNDKQALDACRQFADDHRMLVEPACGAALASVYGDTLTELLQDGTMPIITLKSGCVVVIVCGGVGVRLSDFAN